MPAVVVNARQVRDFAKGTGQLAKTDAIDASILAHFGEVVATTVKPLDSKEIIEFRELHDRRSQLVYMLATEKNHRHANQHGGSAKVAKNIDRIMIFAPHFIFLAHYYSIFPVSTNAALMCRPRARR